MLTVKTATAISRKVLSAVNRAKQDPRYVDWNQEIDAHLRKVGLGWKLKPDTYIDGLDCQFIGQLAKTIQCKAIEIY